MKKYQKTIDLALEHIRKQQSPDGGFIHLSGFAADDFSAAIPRRTTFFTANILACLQTISDRTADIQKAAADFLLAQKSERWSFNYWAHGERQNGDAPSYPAYPDDLDDTFAALAGLARHNAGIIDGRVFCAIARILTAREIQEGGPYRTWLVADDAPAAWQGIDPVVNGTIGYFLSIIGVHIPRLEQYINDAVAHNHLTSPYYPGIFPIGYFFSRFYKHASIQDNAAIRKKLADGILQQLQSSHRRITPLEHAMAISSLINLGFPERIGSGAVDLLVKNLEDEGFLPYAFCIDPARDGKRCYAAASALTAAFCAEALALYYSVFEKNPRTPTIHEYVQLLARATCRKTGRDLHKAMIAQIEKASDERITTLAYEFREALYAGGNVVPLDITEQLSLANFYGWIAYEIYDNVLDDEGSPTLIPCANFFLRELTKIYAVLETRIPGITRLFDATMNRIDEANLWEQRHCRIAAILDAATPSILPSFGEGQTLADRSIGHAMGPLAELLAVGYDAASEEYKNAEAFFRHYLIARQLHDDARDWESDLLRGRVNSAGALILQSFRQRYLCAEETPPANMIPALRKIFWEETVTVMADAIVFHVAEARRARHASSMLTAADFMESALRKLESKARYAVKERDQGLIFLRDYKDSLTPGVSP